jgi:hypothetical protein
LTLTEEGVLVLGVLGVLLLLLLHAAEIRSRTTQARLNSGIGAPNGLQLRRLSYTVPRLGGCSGNI